jgi:type I restriction enzyme S subunit
MFSKLSAMNSNYKRLGDYIRTVDVKNKGLISTDLRGVNYQKFFMPSVANIVGVDLSKYKLIRKGQFACNLMHVGRDECLPVALHRGENPIIVSPAYYAFEIIDSSLLLDEYLFLLFKRKEFDREAWFYTDADVRSGLIKTSFLDMMLPVPPIEEQRRIVAEYQAIEKRIENNRRLIDKLEQTAQTIYRKMFVDDIDPQNLPEGWRYGA